MKKVVCCLFVAFLLLGCSRSDDNYCTYFSAERGDFEQCHWLRTDADALCASKGYSSGAFGEIKDTVGCGGSDDLYISGLTCCK